MNDLNLLSIINQRLTSDKLVLPSLPDVAIEVNKKIRECPDVEIKDIATLIRKDTAIAASVIRFSNSALVKGTVKVDSIEKATVRIGLSRLKNVIMSFAIEQMFFAKDVSVAIKFSDVWRRASDTAASCGATLNYLQSKGKAKHLDPDVMFLTALVHNIGYLPILTELDNLSENLKGDGFTPEFINNLGLTKGVKLNKTILEKWNFTDAIIRAASEWHNTEYKTEDISYVDILRLGLSRTNYIEDAFKSFATNSSIEKEIIENNAWKKSKEFNLHLQNYKNIF